jgi:type III restriction enzyme
LRGDIPHLSGAEVEVGVSDEDLLDSFNQELKNNLSGFATKRSTPTVRQALYLWFRKYLGIQFSDGGIIAIQRVFMHG